jgi:hypothetical protein
VFSAWSTKEQLSSNRGMVLSVRSVPKCYKQNNCRNVSRSKRQIHPVIRDGYQYELTRNCLTVTKNLVLDPRCGLTRRHWLTDRRSKRNSEFDFDFDFDSKFAVGQSPAGKNMSMEVEYSVGIRHQVTTDSKELICAVVNCRESELAIVL